MMKRFWIGGLTIALVASASAETKAWWRFNTDTTSLSNIAGSAAPALRLVRTWGASASWEAPRAAESALVPSVSADAMEPSAVISDPVGKTKTETAIGARTWTQATTNACFVLSKTTGAPIFQVQKFTVETIFRMPDTSRTKGDKMYPLLQVGKDNAEGYLMGVYNPSGSNFYPFFRACTAANKHSEMRANSAVHNVKDGKWHHYAMTVDAEGGEEKATMYLDYVAITNMTLPKVHYGTLSNFIGVNPYQAGRVFEGSIAEIRVSDTVLTPEEMIRPVLKESPLVTDETAIALPFAANDLIAAKPTATFASPAWRLGNAADAAFAPRWLFGTQRPTTETDGTLVLRGANAAGSAIDLGDVAALADGKDVTMELSFKCERADFARGLWSGSWGKAFIYSESEANVKADNNGKLVIRFFATEAAYDAGTSTTYQFKTERVTDGQWRHLAIVAHGAAAEPYVEVFLDRESLGTKKLSLYTGATKNIIFADKAVGVDSSWNWGYDGAADEFRLTRAALDPAEFAASRLPPLPGPEKPILDLDFASGIGGGATAAAREKGSEPTTVKAELGDGNMLALNAGSVVFPASEAYKLDAFTLEFAAKFTSVQLGSALIALSQGEGTGGATIWSLNASDTGKFNVTMNVADSAGTLKNTSYMVKYLNEAADGLWHQWTFTFEKTEDGKMTLNAWMDGVKVLTDKKHSIVGSLAYGDGPCTISIGAKGPWFDGAIDNLRLMPGIVADEDRKTLSIWGGTRIKLR